MRADHDLRRRIEMLRFLLVVGLVLLHYGSYPGSDLSPFRGFRETAHPVATFVNSYALFFFLSAVPLLSAISGWLFFRGLEPNAGFFGRRIRARTRSILVPMVLWNALVLGFFVAAALLWPDPRLLGIVAYDVAALDWRGALDALLGLTRHPIAFQFWFLRDLFLTVLVSPLLALALLRAPLVGAAVLGGSWLLDYDFEIFFRTDVVFFFYLGGLAQVRGWAVAHPAPRLGLALTALFALLVAARTLGPAFIPEWGPTGILLFEYGTRLMRLVGVVALWLVAPLLLGTRLGAGAASLGALAFFLHAAHWPLNQILKQALALAIPGRGDAALLANYALTALLTVVLSVLAARLLAAVAPPVFDLLSGGRSRAFSLRGASTRRAQAGE